MSDRVSESFQFRIVFLSWGEWAYEAKEHVELLLLQVMIAIITTIIIMHILRTIIGNDRYDHGHPLFVRILRIKKLCVILLG